MKRDKKALAEYMREYRKKNAERVREHSRNWKRRNKWHDKRMEQAHAKRDSIIYTNARESMTLPEWSKKLGIDIHTLHIRVSKVGAQGLVKESDYKLIKCEKRSALASRYYNNNRERLREYARQWYAKNKKRILAKKKNA
jgi:hypothetical protein